MSAASDLLGTVPSPSMRFSPSVVRANITDWSIIMPIGRHSRSEAPPASGGCDCTGDDVNACHPDYAPIPISQVSDALSGVPH